MAPHIAPTHAVDSLGDVLLTALAMVESLPPWQRAALISRPGVVAALLRLLVRALLPHLLTAALLLCLFLLRHASRTPEASRRPAAEAAATPPEADVADVSRMREADAAVVDADERAASPVNAAVTRHDCGVAAAQRKACVPLAQWTNAVEVRGGRLYVSAQFGADDDGVLAARPQAQCEAAFRNVERALVAGGRTFDDVAHLTVMMVHGRCSLAEYRHVEARYLRRDALPALTFAYVPALASANILVQIAAVAV
ncbi:Endoribonuclease L-PSP/chorismate mutase-like protein [Pelagophyceae sp. CCMP2097]|nr:Endoribonuclease L-PSP/chorismate mutase-like protein [Pelagophyceae sp. CCMP2097]